MVVFLSTGRGTGDTNEWEQIVGEDDHWEQEGDFQEIGGVSRYLSHCNDGHQSHSHKRSLSNNNLHTGDTHF